MLSEISARMQLLTSERNEATLHLEQTKSELQAARIGLTRARHEAARFETERRQVGRHEIQLSSNRNRGFDPARLQLRGESPPRREFHTQERRRTRRVRRVDNDYEEEIISRRDRNRSERFVITEDSDSE